MAGWSKQINAVEGVVASQNGALIIPEGHPLRRQSVVTLTVVLVAGWQTLVGVLGVQLERMVCFIYMNSSR